MAASCGWTVVEMCVALAGIVAEALNLHEDPQTRVAEVFAHAAALECTDPPPPAEDDRCTVLRARPHAGCPIARALLTCPRRL